MVCEICEIETPTKYVEIYQNIGVLVLNLHKSVKGNLCRSCVNAFCRRYTLITLAAGWCGIFGIVLTPIFLINNATRYLLCRRLEYAPAGSARPILTQEAVGRLRLRKDEILSRLASREKLRDIAEHIATTSGVTAGQVILYIAYISEARDHAGLGASLTIWGP